MVFNGVLVNPMEMVNIVRHHLLEFRAGQCAKRSEGVAVCRGLKLASWVNRFDGRCLLLA